MTERELGINRRRAEVDVDEAPFTGSPTNGDHCNQTTQSLHSVRITAAISPGS